MVRVCLVGILVLGAGAYAQPQGRGPANWRFISAETGRSGRVVKGAPFSADITTETTQVLADGNRIHQTSSSRLYRDGEGRTRREQSLQSLGGLTSNANLPPVIFINDPVAGVDYALSPSSRTATKTARPDRGVPGGGGMSRGAGMPGGGGMAGGRSTQGGEGPGFGRRMRGGPGPGGGQDIKVESLGRQNIEGVPADGARTTVTVPTGEMGNEQPIQIVTESWYSPDLQVEVLFKRSDPRNGDTITRYTNISRTEPVLSLFEPPPDFKVSEMGGGRRGGGRQ